INTEVLVRNKAGKIGLKQADEKVPALLMFLQSKDYQFYKAGKPADAKTAAEFNKGGIAHLLTVGWKVHDVLINNAVDYDSAKEPFSEFTIRQSGVYEMSGYVLYKTNCELKAGFASAKNAADCFRNNYAGVIVAIQYKEPQAAQWINTTTTLQIWPLGAINYTLTVAVPPVVKHLNAGDKLRMVFYRPSENFGLPHGNSGKVYDGDTEGTFGIYSADGIEAVRSFKIVGIN
ncbi:MAG: hypothetical protein LBH58_07445, partial [Tannerellaceae bacterium]|nr:hypothetical protein [Tannerellaceae bacterium]